MKRVVIFLCAFIPCFVFCQNIHNNLQIPNFLGNLYVKNSWANTSDFTAFGSPTFSASAGTLLLSGGNQHPSATVGTVNTAFNQVEKITSYGGTMLERWKFSTTYVINNTPGSTTYGIGVGTYSTAAGGLSNAIGYFDASTATGTGKVYLLLGASNTTAAISNTALTFSSGDTILLTTERIADRIVATALNKTTGVIVEVGYIWDQSSSANILTPNTGNFAIVNFGGAAIITNIGITSNEVVGANIMLVGDSKFAGYSTPWDLRIASILNRYYPATISCSGEGDRTQDALNHWNEIVSLHPKKIIFCIGRNDLAGGVATGTWQANLDTLAARCNVAGIAFYSLDAIYETAQSQTSLINFLDTAVLFSGNVIQTYAPGNFTGSTGYGDNIHPSYLGTQAVVDVIRRYFALTNNGQFLNDRFSIRGQDVAYNTLSVLGGDLNMNVFNSNNLWYNPSQGRTGHDIIMAAGSRLTAAYGAGTQANSIVLSGVGNATMEFRSYTGGLNANDIFSWYTASSGSTGNQTKNLALTEGGYLRVGANGLPGSVAGNAGDIFIPSNGKIGASTTTDGRHEAFITLMNSGHSQTNFHNYDSVGHTVGVYNFFVNPAGLTPGRQVNALSISEYGNLIIGDSVDRYGSKAQINGGIWQNKDSIPISSAASVYALGLDSVSGNYVRFAPPVYGQTTLVAGTKSITIAGLTSSSIPIVTLSSPSGASLTIQYQASCTTNTLIIQANVAAGTINISDGSIINYSVSK